MPGRHGTLAGVRADEARALLGVTVGASPSEVRAAWRRCVRGSHPDVSAGADAAGRTARLNEAYALLRALPAPVPVVTPEPPVDGDDTLIVTAPADEAFLALLEAGHRTGDVTYVDRSAGLLELVVDVAGTGTCSVLVTLQGRADGTTHAFVTVESLADPGWRPSAAVLTGLLGSLAGRG